MYVCTYVCMYVCIYVYMYVCICDTCTNLILYPHHHPWCPHWIVAHPEHISE